MNPRLKVLVLAIALTLIAFGAAFINQQDAGEIGMLDGLIIITGLIAFIFAVICWFDVLVQWTSR